MIVPYPLEDNSLIADCLARAATFTQEYQDHRYFSSFVPSASYVSLGASNNLEDNVHLENCREDGVVVFKRLSGGEAVFLSPNCAVFSHIYLSNNTPKSSDFFGMNLDLASAALKSLGVQNISRRGISDLAVVDKKILGCAIYRRPKFILFQAVVNVREDPDVIERYLKHPVREPDYRKNRPHSDFVTSLVELGNDLSPMKVAIRLQEYLGRERRV